MTSSPLLSSPGTSRRSFLRLASLAATLPAMSEGYLARAAMQSAPVASAFPKLPHAADAQSVMINANENPLGPCDAALAAITAIARTGGRYDATGCQDELTDLLAKEYNLPTDHFAIYAGSSEPLQFATLAFTSPSRPYVTADPSYESGMAAAAAGGARVVKVPLTSTYAHDVKAMIAAAPDAGLFYICNPNNPTGTLTPREDILWALEHKPPAPSSSSTKPTSTSPTRRRSSTRSPQAKTSSSCARSPRSTAWPASAAASCWAVPSCLKS
jgi:histidinol-phosphate aminotransferase